MNREANLRSRPAILVVLLFLTGALWNCATVRGEAQPEFPADGDVITGYIAGDNIWTKLIFLPGATAVKHTGYFSDDYSKVESRAQDANLGSPPYAHVPGWEYTFFAGNPQVAPADDSLVRGAKYYWTVDETDALGNTFAGEIWEFTILGDKAFDPSPPNEATFVETDVLLCWSEPVEAQEYDVYIGTDWNDVNNAPFLDPNLPPFPLFLGTVSGTCIQVTGLAFDTKYYWRVDAVYGRFPPPIGGGVYYKGDVWSFTTRPGPIFVDVDAVGANNGTSWENAYNFLQDGLSEAESALKPVEIRVAEGIYKPDRSTADPNGSGSRGVSFVLIDGVTIKGGYAGFGEPDPNARDIEAYETILSGDLAGNDADVNEAHELLDDPCRAENSCHVVFSYENDANAVLDGFTITGGNAKASRIGGG